MAKKELDIDTQPGFPKKWAKKLSPDWMDTAQSYSTDELKKKIVQWEQAISSTEKDEEADPLLHGMKEKMADLKEEIKEKSKPYRESVDQCQAQIKFAVFILESRGVPVTG